MHNRSNLNPYTRHYLGSRVLLLAIAALVILCVQGRSSQASYYRPPLHSSSSSPTNGIHTNDGRYGTSNNQSHCRSHKSSSSSSSIGNNAHPFVDHHQSGEHIPSSSSSSGPSSVSLWNPRGGGGNETQRKRRRSTQKLQLDRQQQQNNKRIKAHTTAAVSSKVCHESTTRAESNVVQTTTQTSNGHQYHKRKQSKSEWIGVPPVRIGGMVLNPAQDEEALSQEEEEDEKDDPKDSHNPIVHTTAAAAAPHPHPHPHPLPSPTKRTLTLTHTTSSHHTTSSLLQVPCSLLLQHTSHPRYPSTSSPIPVSTYLDTGAQGTIMTLRAVKRAGLSHLIDTRYAGRAVGVAGVSCRVIGRIPARTVGFVFRRGTTSTYGGREVVVDRSPSICVLEEGIGDCAASSTTTGTTQTQTQAEEDGQGGGGNSIELLLGLDALEEWNAAICLRDRTLTIRSPDKTNTQEEEELVISFLDKCDANRTRRTPPGDDDDDDDDVFATKPPIRSSSRIPPPAPPSSSPRNRRYRRATLKSTAAINARKPHPPDANKRLSNYPSSSIPWVISSRRMPTTDLESDLDLLDSTNTGKKPPIPRTLSSVHDTTTDTTTTTTAKNTFDDDHEYMDDHDDDDDEDDGYFESDNEYDGCNLSGI